MLCDLVESVFISRVSLPVRVALTSQSPQRLLSLFTLLALFCLQFLWKCDKSFLILYILCGYFSIDIAQTDRFQLFPTLQFFQCELLEFSAVQME
jgi:hypothetical protein